MNEMFAHPTQQINAHENTEMCPCWLGHTGHPQELLFVLTLSEYQPLVGGKSARRSGFMITLVPLLMERESVSWKDWASGKVLDQGILQVP